MDTTPNLYIVVRPSGRFEVRASVFYQSRQNDLQYVDTIDEHYVFGESPIAWGGEGQGGDVIDG